VYPNGHLDIQVAGPAAAGGSTTIASDRITINGQPLDHVYAPQSPGSYVAPAQMYFVCSLTKIGSSWYVVPKSSVR
jgi:hypothetical protein